MNGEKGRIGRGLEGKEKERKGRGKKGRENFEERQRGEGRVGGSQRIGRDGGVLGAPLQITLNSSHCRAGKVKEE